jgi:hypothetical protein
MNEAAMIDLYSAASTSSSIRQYPQLVGHPHQPDRESASIFRMI